MEEQEEHANWGYLWNQMQWKRQYVAVSRGKLQVFPSDQRDHTERKLLLNGAVVKVVEPTETGKASLENMSKSHFWRKLSRNSHTNQNLPEPEGAIVIVKSSNGKKMFMLTSTQDEAETWKAVIEKESMRTIPEKQRTKTKLLLRLLTPRSSKKGGVEPIKLQRRLRWEANHNEQPSQSLGLDTLEHCTSFLKLSPSCRRGFEVVASMIDQFNGSYQMGSCQLSNELRIEAWKGTLLTMIRTLHHELQSESSTSPEQTEMLWLACEAWVMARVHDKIMGACEQMFATDDKGLARIQLKLREVDPSLLGVPPHLKDVAFGEAIQVFGMINSFRTPLEKAVCLRRTVNCVLEGVEAARHSSKDGDNLTCTDDLLSLMLLLMSHAKVQHLQATACYVENFFQIYDLQNSGELRYHITNFVAACAYLSSPEIKELVSDDALLSPSSSSSKSSSSSSASSPSSSNFNPNSGEFQRVDTNFAAKMNDSPPEFILAPTYL